MRNSMRLTDFQMTLLFKMLKLDGSNGSVNSKVMNSLLKSMKIIFAIHSTCKVSKRSLAKTRWKHASKWFYRLSNLMKTISMTRHSSSLTRSRLTCIAWSTLASFSTRKELPKFTRNSSTVRMELVREHFVIAKRYFRSVSVILFVHHASRTSVRDVKKSIFQKHARSMLTVLVLAQASHLSSWCTILKRSSYHQKSTSMSQRFSDSKFKANVDLQHSTHQKEMSATSKIPCKP